ncbi:breast cancer susceptibility1 [Tasmannia lanceolata]|uniref:breast cancer susceptibility1 n=1 Tax=Tasmannia lanceolata TaxID=3420 RepID=UPI004063B8EE
MADSSHLEKLGRELKCPICLSLLNTAVSLTCNHVFCGSCISKSMKSASDCPVCKVPYRRREVRAAPHMDNLVSIYKSMEVASGTNIFVTQTAILAGKSDGQMQGDPDSKHGGAAVDETSGGKLKKQKALKCKGSKELEKTDLRFSDSHPSTKPSFPAKKRVQVPLGPLSETPARPEKVPKLGNQITEGEAKRESGKASGKESGKNGSTTLKEKAAFNEKGDPVFSPFFWLREEDDNDEDAEKLSQRIDDDCLTNTPPCKLPSFSDIEDSDNGNPTKMTPTEELHSKSKVADIFDSEMFEWTQRACSPELLSTPIKKKTVDGQELDAVEHKESREASQVGNALSNGLSASENMKSPNCKQESENVDVERLVLSSQTNENGIAKNRSKSIRSKRPNSKVQRNCVERLINRSGSAIEEISVDSTKFTENLGQTNECTESAITLNPGRKSSKRGKKSSYSHRKSLKKLVNQINAIATDKVLIEAPMKSSEGKDLSPENENMGMELPVPSSEQTEKSQHMESKTSKIGEKIDTQHRRKRVKKLISEVVDTTLGEVQNEAPINGNQGNENMNTEFPVSSCLQTQHEKNIKSRKKTSRRGEKICNKVHGNRVRQLKGRKRSAKQDNDVATDGAFKETSPSKSSNKENQIIRASKEHFLLRCGSIPERTPCAFCQSCDVSDASGEMVHYFNGKPVAADYNGVSNLIHSHKHCTEWAPNVYFEDDIAINLKTEIARSKRIKCSCCGVKGAALGCYEKSCHKSFHVPCAKLVAECRWDTENFVMLCPLHPTSKLPKEFSEPQKQSQKRSVPKLEKQTQAIAKPGLKTSGVWKWASGSPSKWVICCSALTVAEKEIVSEFTRLAGVPVSKTWSSGITHVIASTDENGACKRTLKFLKGILDGLWILKIDWIKDCLLAMEPVDEEQYEIRVDIHGINGGPRLGRLRVMNKQPKLFTGFKFYFTGEFMPSYKGYLQELIFAGGGIVLQRKPISRDQERPMDESSSLTIFIIYSVELPEKCASNNKSLIINQRTTEAETIANAIGAKAASNLWILDCIAACRLQTFN